MEETIYKIISEKFNIIPNSETNIAELGQDSFGKVEMLFEIEEKLKVRLPEHEIMDIETVGELLEVIKKLKGVENGL